jgi:hypothetical protein
MEFPLQELGLVISVTKLAGLFTNPLGAMNNGEAVCLKCGEWKKAPYSKCPSCGLKPQPGSDDEIKSVYLSLGRFEDADDRKNYGDELEELATRIKTHASIDFDAADLRRLEEQRGLVRSTSPKQAWLAIFRFFLPAILFLLALALLVFLLKALR